MTGVQRHGCLTAWLIFMIVANALAAFVNLVVGGALGALTGVPGWMLPMLGILGIFNVASSIALLNWKKWGFFGIVTSSIVAAAINVAAGIGAYAAFGVAGAAVLYGLLQMGGTNRAWPHLR